MLSRIVLNTHQTPLRRGDIYRPLTVSGMKSQESLRRFNPVLSTNVVPDRGPFVSFLGSAAPSLLLTVLRTPKTPLVCLKDYTGKTENLVPLRLVGLRPEVLLG